MSVFLCVFTSTFSCSKEQSHTGFVFVHLGKNRSTFSSNWGDFHEVQWWVLTQDES